MQPVVQAVLRSWSIPPAATFALVLAGLTYLRGCWLLRRAGYPHLPAWRIGSFALGLFALWFALASPLDTIGPLVLTAHMLQHMILMMVAPPLLLLGEPLIPIVRGMPRFAAREFAGPFLNWQVAERIGLALTNPVIALVLMGTMMFAWHVPRLYELALGSSTWHEVEHACFFFASIIFWWPVIQPWPSRAQWPRWAMVPYLVIADLQNTVLSAVLVFPDKILYPSYAAGPSLFGLSPKEDQAAAGAIMWVVGSLAFIVPAVLIAIQCLSRRRPDSAGRALRSTIATSGAASAIDDARNFLAERIFRTRLTPRFIEATSFVVLFTLIALGFATLSRLSTDDDDQVLRLSQSAGPFIVAVYGPAGDVPAGAASFAVLVQDRSTQDVLLDANIRLSSQKTQGTDEKPQSVRTSATDENQLLSGANLNLDSVGPQILEVAVARGSERVTVWMPVNVIRPEAGMKPEWSYIVILAIAAMLCGVYVWRHRTHAPTRLPTAVTSNH